MPYNNETASIKFWHLEFNPDMTIIIYEKKGGMVLMEYEGMININVIRFYGNYIRWRPTMEDYLQMNVSGEALFLFSRIM